LSKNSSQGFLIEELKASALIEEVSTINSAEIKAEIMKLDYSRLDAILRELVKYDSRIYLQNTKEQTKSNYIPAAGKVIEESELMNMLDASLDMWLTTGRFNEQFENELAKFLGIRHALTVNSGSSANLLALSALTSHKLKDKRLKPKDEVITVAAGFPTTVNPIIQNGLIPVFVDVDLKTFGVKSEQIEESITKKTKAVFIAHTLGNPFNLDKVLEICRRHNLWLIEDNCDALGSEYKGKYTGTFGHIGTMSFYPAHHITMGEGGAVVTNDPVLFDILASMRDWGRDCYCPSGKDNTCGKRFEQQHGKLPFGYDHKYVYAHPGYNFKITDWQAAIGLSQLKKLPDFIKKRQNNFVLLKAEFKKFEKCFILPEAAENSNPSWFGFWLTLKENLNFSKKALVDFLEKSGIGTRNLFAGNILRQPVFVDDEIKIRIRNSGVLISSDLKEEHYALLPNTDAIMQRSFWIGLWPGISENEIKYISSKINEFI
jgi:CDP-6-deoxy-D-xylo-4-hexulose-3-dehydrase